ncbi:C39 family peptidase [Deinococcus sp. Leaf326]|uniref:C39 family peptidase n=1 Tax=Deinococcus sp. Leaf326 TaxID=1736338 RepID=UPI000A5DAD07|nr:C39 family peptidase [Deinococcus sp. Leaf326]
MRLPRFLYSAAALLALLGPAASAAAPAPTGYTLQGVPLIRQTYNACGPASITQVLGYFGLRVALADVSRLTRPTERSYMTAQAIVDFAPQVGMEARLYSGGSLATVRAAIRQGLPLIALQSHIPRAGTVIAHWRVVVGYDDASAQVELMDPLLGHVAMGYADFARVWADHRGQFAVLYPPHLRVRVGATVG